MKERRVFVRCLLAFALSVSTAACVTAPIQSPGAKGARTGVTINPLYKGIHPPCTAGEAISVSLAEFRTNPTPYLERCVRVRGVVDGGYFFYDNLSELYRQNHVSAYKQAVGLYAPSDETRDDLFRTRFNVEVIARASTCAAQSERVDQKDRASRLLAKMDGFITFTMLTGFCHYTENPVLFVSAFTPLPGLPQRLQGEEARARTGDLREVDASWSDYAAVLRLSTAWFDALRRRDVAAAAALSGVSNVSKALNDDRSLLHALFVSADSPERFLFGQDAIPKIHIFVESPATIWDTNVSMTAFGCICRSGDCKNQWPIHSIDAWSYANWPYSCIWIERLNGKLVVGRS